MGAEPWFYFVPYQSDISQALHDLRRREFEAGRYNPVIPTLYSYFPLGADSPCPGREHSSIKEAIRASGDDGTRSILDMERLSNHPANRAVSPLDLQFLLAIYGTAKPTREQLEENMDFFELIDRGQGLYVIAYRGSVPTEILFAGYSFD